MNIKILFLYTLITFAVCCNSSFANVERLWGVQEMYAKSAFVADGEIIKVTKIKSITKNLPNGMTIVTDKCQAKFKVSNALKGDRLNNEIWTIQYTFVRSNLYRGDQVGELIKGDKFRLFARKVTVELDGTVQVFLISRNEVRRDAYDTSIK